MANATQKSSGPVAKRARSARTRAQFEAYVAIQRTAEALQREFAELFRTHGLSVSQYNVLRILRGAESDGLSCREIGGRMLQHDPDITRLLDRLERQGFIRRTRDAGDRRVVRTVISREGLDVLAALDEPVDALHERQLGHLSARELGSLRALAERTRAG